MFHGFVAPGLVIRGLMVDWAIGTGIVSLGTTLLILFMYLGVSSILMLDLRPSAVAGSADNFLEECKRYDDQKDDSSLADQYGFIRTIRSIEPYRSDQLAGLAQRI